MSSPQRRKYIPSLPGVNGTTVPWPWTGFTRLPMKGGLILKNVHTTGIAQAQAKLNAVGFKQFSQAQTAIYATSSKYSQAQVQIKSTYQGYSQAQTLIKQTYMVYAQTGVAILQTYRPVAQAGTGILATYFIAAQANAQILTTYMANANAEASINIRYTTVSNAQTWIQTTYSVSAQSQTYTLRPTITYTIVSQAEVSIYIVSTAISQAEVFIVLTSYQIGRAQAVLNQGWGLGQAEVWIFQTYNVYGNSQAHIYAIEIQTYSQAQTILNQSLYVAQSQAHVICFNNQQYAQALAWIAIKVYGQAFLDTFSRLATTAPPFNVGTADTGQLWKHTVYGSNQSAANSTTYVDGSAFIFANPIYTYNVGSVSGPTTVPDEGDIYVDIYIPSARQSYYYHYFYWYDKKWYFYIYDINSVTYGISGQHGSTTLAVTRNSWYRIHIKVNSQDTGQYVKGRMWKVEDTEPGTWTTLQMTWPLDAIDSSYDYLKPVLLIYTPYSWDSLGVRDYVPHKMDNIQVITSYYQMINYGAGNTQAAIKTTYQIYSQAQVILNQSMYVGQSQAHIYTTYQIYNQTQAFISKLAGYAQAQTKIAFPIDSYRDKIQADGATHYYGMRTVNAYPNTNYLYFKDELGIKNSDVYSASSSSSTVSSPLGSERIGIVLNNNSAYRGWVGTDGRIPEFLTSTWSYDAWVRAPAASPGVGVITGLYLQSPYHYFDLYFGSATSETSSGTTLNAWIYENGTATYYNTGITYIPNAWYHIAITYSNKVFKIYVDGVLKNQITRSTWSATGSTYNFYLGYSAYHGNGYGYIGGYDSLAIYPIELSQGVIQDHYAKGNTYGIAQAQVILNQYRQTAGAQWYIFNSAPGATNIWQQFAHAHSHITVLVSSTGLANVRITDAKDQNVYAASQAIIIPQQGLLRYFIQGSVLNYALPDQGTYDQITSMTAVTDVGQINETDYGSNYGIRWQAWFYADLTGAWTFHADSDDGSGVFIYNEQNQLVGSVVANYPGSPGNTTGTINLVSGTKYKIDVKYAEGGGSSARCNVYYMRPGDTVEKRLLAGGAPWNDKSTLRFWGLGLANAWWVARNGDWFVWPKYAQAQTKVYYPELKGYAQAQVQIGAFWPAQAHTRVAGTGKYEYEIEIDLPVSYFKLQETSLSSPVANRMRPVDATYGSQVVLDQAGPLNILNDSNSKAVYLNSNSTSIINLPASTVYQDTFTLELWVKSDNNTITIQTESTSGTAGTSGQRYLWKPDQRGSNAGLGVSLGTNGIGVYEHGSSYLAPLAVYSGTLGTSWHHVVITEYQKVAKIYLDGVLVRTGLTSLRSIIYSPSVIGIGDWGTKWTGTVAEVAIYNYLLTPERILAHYMANQGKLEFSQAQTKINAFNVQQYAQTNVQVGFFWPAQAQAHIKVYDFPRVAQAHALIQGDYGLTRMTWNNARWVVGDIFSWDAVEGIIRNNPNYSSSGTNPTPFPGDSDWGMAWSGNFIADVTGTWQFRTTSDDGSEVYISGTRVVDNGFGTGHGTQTVSGTIDLVQGNFYTIHARWGQGTGPWNISIQYKRPADADWNYLTDNAPPWIRKYWYGGVASAQAWILPIPNIKVYAQAQAKLNSFNYPQRAQAQADILQTYRKYAQAGVVLNQGWGLAQSKVLVSRRDYGSAQAQAVLNQGWGIATAQAKLNAFGVKKYASTKTHIKAYGVQQYAQAKFLIMHIERRPAQAQAQIKQTYPFRYIDPNYALTSLDTTVLPDPNFSLEGTLPENVLDGDIYSVWTSFLAIDELEEIYFYLNLDLGIARTISSYYILPVDYDATANLQYSRNNTDWTDIVTGIYFNVNVVDPIKYTDAIRGEIEPTLARYWRLKFTSGGNDNKVTIATFQLGTSTLQNPTFGQAQVFLGHFGVAQALSYTAPGLSTYWAQAGAQIKQTYSAQGNAQFWYLPPTAFGLTQALITQVYQYTGQAMVWALPPTAFGLSEVSIKTTYRTSGQSLTDILQTYTKNSYVQAKIAKSMGHANARALIYQRGKGIAYAMVYVGHFVYGTASVFISKNKSYAQALADIKQDYAKYGQALVLMRRSETYSQSLGLIRRTYRVYSQTQAILNQHRRFGLSRVWSVRTYTPVGNGLAGIKATISNCSQAQVIIRVRHPDNHGQARALVWRRSLWAGQAITQVGAFIYSQAQAQIIAFNVPKVGVAAGYILVDTSIPAPHPTSNLQSYLVMYNNQTLPGYAQKEFMNSVSRLSTSNSPYKDNHLVDYLGLENKEISLTMLVWEPTYLECKIRVQEAATILRSKRKVFNKLYIQQYNKYYEAMPKAITTDKAVGTNTQRLEYTVTFEAKPWLIANDPVVLIGTGSVETADRTLLDGGWTPTTIIVSGTDITISGITEYGESTGEIAISGTVSNYIIDSKNFQVSDTTLITPKDYGIYVGPGKTTFTITGASDCRIEYYNRWYL